VVVSAAEEMAVALEEVSGVVARVVGKAVE